ncbi:MAG: fused MFS/spermidine synthase, partial [Acidimicrobiia bacterium]
VGLTLETYTAAVGVALAGIAAGSALGGWSADTWDPRRWLGPMLLIAGAALTLTRPVVILLGPPLRSGGPAATVLLVTLSAGPPALLLSTVPPAVVRLRLRRLSHTGRVVGRLSATSTVGALFGSAITGFGLLAVFSTSTILLGAAGLVSVAGLLTTLVVGRSTGGGRRGSPVAALVGMVVASATLVAATLAGAGPCDSETRYYCVRIEEDRARPGGRLLLLDDLRHAYVDLDDPGHLEFGYARRVGSVLDAIAPTGRSLQALHIGGGGFTIPRYLAATRPGSTSTVLEIDPDVVELARARLGLAGVPGLRVKVGDARRNLADEKTAGYEVVVGDAFGTLSVPWHLATRQLAEEVSRVLRPGGIYVLNLIDQPPLRFLAAELATLRAVFPEVAVLAPGLQLGGGVGGNFVLVASDRRLPLPELRAAAALGGEPGGVGDSAVVDALSRRAKVLTDDRAPVDQLITPRAPNSGR